MLYMDICKDIAGKCAEIHTEEFTGNRIRELIANHVPSARVPRKVNIITDTSDFFRVEYDNVVILENRPYLIRNNKCEGRFGVCDQPKFWVKSAIDLYSGDSKIIKMVYHERFKTSVGDLTFDCVRSPRKEARILDLVKGHPYFMQGFSTMDSAGNIIRIIDYISGKTIADYILHLGNNHEEYFYNYFPVILDEFIELVEAIKFIHEHNEKHGDIRRDHIIKDKNNDTCRWIDFDFNYMHKESMFSYDLFGLGNILTYLTGKGDITLQTLKKDNQLIFENLTFEDLNIVYQNRIVNLKKIYPYIPSSLNFILLHFSAGAYVFYDNALQLIYDLMEARDDL